ncbi:MAG: energy-coupling factor transporter transmembrane protein EcfT [Caldilineae bacterium]|nr:MAG: energy-coupling factor transporter transmembrane protein EcfT [Caldilineae bacterium]
MNGDYHPYTWLLWLASGTLVAVLVRNPFYLFLELLAAAFVYAVILRRGRIAGPATAGQARALAWKGVIKLAIILWLFTLLFNALTVHVGPTVLFTLPQTWPLVGGPITLEAMAYGFATGLSFVSLILVFTVFNSAVGPHTLLRMVPGFAHHAGVALTIALSFIPQTVLAWHEIREAQRLRGYRVTRLRDMRPLFVSLLGIGLDRAIRLAESMEARGFAGNMAPLGPRQHLMVRAGTVLALLALVLGLASRSFLPRYRWVGPLLMLAGAALLLLVFRIQGRRLRRSRYRRWLWRRRDTVVSAAAGLLLVATLGLAIARPELLFYYPYPPYDLLPHFHPLLGFLCMLMIAPALLLPPMPARPPFPASAGAASSP